MLMAAAAKSRTLVEVQKRLGLIHYSGGMSNHLRMRMAALGIDTSHFVGRAWASGTQPRNRKKPEELFLVRTNGYRARGYQLRRVLIESGVLWQCVSCGLEPEWNGKALTLVVDHINGDWRDCRKDNLRFLCPNCHSQEPTSIRQGIFVEVQCEECGLTVRKRKWNKAGPKVCSKACAGKRARRRRSKKGAWPDDSNLRELVWSIPVELLAKQIGVTGTAVKKRCKSLGINTPPRGFWQKIRGSSPGGERAPTKH